MPDLNTEPTPYPDVNTVVLQLFSGAKSILGAHFVGMYLHGSLAGGDFNPERSDIDFLVVTAGELPEDKITSLAKLHGQIRHSDLVWSKKVEGDYIPRPFLRRYDPKTSCYPHLGTDGHFEVEPHGSDVILQHYVLRKKGVVIAGPNPKSPIDPIQPDDLRRAARATLDEWWAPMLSNPTLLCSREYQAYAVLTMCRALYTLAYGDVIPKPVAAQWSQKLLGKSWERLIERALAWPNGPQPDELEATKEFIYYTLDRSQEKESFDNLRLGDESG
jgi:hypothetical protein